MGEFSPIHWLIVLVVFGVIIGIPWLAYRHGRRVGDQQGYIRGYKEGQASKS
jgi:Sec-independent protein translocase protein TatA